MTFRRSFDKEIAFGKKVFRDEFDKRYVKCSKCNKHVCLETSWAYKNKQYHLGCLPRKRLKELSKEGRNEMVL